MHRFITYKVLLKKSCGGLSIGWAETAPPPTIGLTDLPKLGALGSDIPVV